jgi:surface protein
MVTGEVYTIYDVQLTIPGLYSETYNATVSWGDGSADSIITAYNDPDLAHTYPGVATYEVTVSGTFPAIYFGQVVFTDKLAMRTIENLGAVGWTTFFRSFYGSTNMTTLSVSNADLSSVSSMERMFYNLTSVTTIPDVSEWNVSNVTNMGGLFEAMTALNSPPAVGAWNVGNVTRFKSVFHGLALTSPPDVSQWDVGKGISFQETFRNCQYTTPPDVSNWDTSSAENFMEMFADCDVMTSPPDVSNWDTSSLLDANGSPTHGGALYRTFTGMTALTTPPDVSTWDVSSVRYLGFRETFQDMSGVTSPPDVSDWDMYSGGATSMADMFRGMTSLTTPPDISGWNTSNFADISRAFRSMSSLTSALDISDFEIDSVTANSQWLLNISDDGITTTEIDGFLLNAYQTSSYGGGTGIAGTGLSWDFGPDLSDCYTDDTSIETGTADSDSENELVDSSQNFTSTVQQYDCVYNIDDDAWDIVQSVTDDTTLVLSGDSFPDGNEQYRIEDKTDPECALEALSISTKDNLSFTLNNGAQALGACP